MKHTILYQNMENYFNDGYKSGAYFTGKGSVRKGSNGYKALLRLYHNTLIHEPNKFDIVLVEGAHCRYKTEGSEYMIMYKPNNFMLNTIKIQYRIGYVYTDVPEELL